MDTENSDSENTARGRGNDSAKYNATWVPIRFMAAFLAFIGFTFNYMLRVGPN